MMCATHKFGSQNVMRMCNWKHTHFFDWPIIQIGLLWSRLLQSKESIFCGLAIQSFGNTVEEGTFPSLLYTCQTVSYYIDINPLNAGVKCRRQARFWQFLSKFFKIQIFIVISGFGMKNAFKSVQTCLVLMQWFLWWCLWFYDVSVKFHLLYS